MEKKENESQILKEANYKSFFKGQEILKNSINSIEIERSKYKRQVIKSKLKVFKSNSATLLNFDKTNKKSEIKSKFYIKAVKNIYKKYKMFLNKWRYSIKKINIFTFRNYYKQKSFSKSVSKVSYFKYLTIQSYFKFVGVSISSLIYFLRKLSKTSVQHYKAVINKFLLLNNLFQTSYLKNLLSFERSSINFYNSIKKKYKKSIVSIVNLLNKNNISNFFTKKFKTYLINFIKNLQKNLNNILFIDKKEILSSIKRLRFVSCIYFLPFIYLANEALIPYIPEYNYSIVNPLSSQIFEKFPILVQLIKLFRPLIIRPNLQLWILIGYLLIFPLGYRSLKLSYKVAYNGTIALIFLMINYSCTLGQEIMRVGFESIKMIKDILFTSYLIKHLGKTKNKEKEVAFSLFNNLIIRYDFQTIDDYYNFILLVSHRVFSQLALISLIGLLYNCLYYIAYNKNPEIPLVTKAALRTIKNPQEEE